MLEGMSYSSERLDESDEGAQHGLDEGTLNYTEGGYCEVQLFETELHSSQSTYIPLRKIANGRFSTVYLCRDIKMKRYVAVKICQAGLDPEISADEVAILQQVARNCHGLRDNGGIVMILDSFVYEKSDFDASDPPRCYFCIVFELLGHSVYRLLTRYTPNINYYKAIPMPIVKTIALCLLKSVHYLHHTAKIIHTDLKPENLSMMYYLPLISENSSYDLGELIFGPYSYEIFDAKLSTPAPQINYFDYKLQKQPTRHEIQQYIMYMARQRGIYSWHEAKQQLMDHTNYKDRFAYFIKLRGSAEADASVSCYYIDGMNIFNLPNLICTAESIFRLQQLPTNFSQQNDDISITRVPGKRPTVRLCDARNVLLSYDDPSVLGTTLQTHQYEIQYESQFDPAKKLFTASNKIKYVIAYAIHDYGQLETALSKCCVESTVCNPHDHKSVTAGAKSGLHSRIQLKAMVDKAKRQSCAEIPDENSRTSMTLPELHNIDCCKCFAMTTAQWMIYPTMISYYSKKQLIPFCPEMFKIKIVDLGNACYLDKRFSSVVQTINYRAPEIIVGFKQYTYKIDEFSVGCIIFELLTGNVLFNPRINDKYDPLYHLQQIVQTVGEDGLEWLLEHCTIQELVETDAAQRSRFKFDGKLQFRSVATQLVNDYGFEREVAVSVEQLILPLLRLNPEKRAECSDLFANAWLKNLGSGDFLLHYDGRW